MLPLRVMLLTMNCISGSLNIHPTLEMMNRYSWTRFTERCSFLKLASVTCDMWYEHIFWKPNMKFVIHVLSNT